MSKIHTCPKGASIKTNNFTYLFSHITLSIYITGSIKRDTISFSLKVNTHSILHLNAILKILFY